MNNPRHQKRLIRVIALAGIGINFAYGIGLLHSFFSPQLSHEVQEILISAIALEFGWAALLTRVVVWPLESRHLLLFTGLTMALANGLHAMHQWVHTGDSTGAIALNLLTGMMITGLFVLAAFIGQFRSLPGRPPLQQQ